MSSNSALLNHKNSTYFFAISRVYALVGAIIFFLMAYAFNAAASVLSIYLCMFMLISIIGFYRNNYLSLPFAFSIGWILVLFFSTLNISDFSRDVNPITVIICGSCIFINFIVFSPAVSPRYEIGVKENAFTRWFNLYVMIFMIMALANVAISGYIPLLSMLSGGGSDYKNFGLPGLYGFFLAYSNALGVTAIYFYIKNGQSKYIYIYILIIAVFLLFVTRQNVMSLLIESLFVYCICRKRIGWGKIITITCIVLVLFSIVGEMRSGNIRDIARIKSDFEFLPASIIWLYSYSYFNILNLDNLLQAPGAPFFDFSSFSRLVPSFLRPDGEYINVLEVLNFNVASYIYSLYLDMGIAWVIIFSITVNFIGYFIFNKIKKESSYFWICSGSVFFFCFMMSFFINFWLYLPIIFQIVFFYIFSKTVVIRKN
ncbi:O-antigen polymerase [Halotalea alkalilenta]|uniref:O-antigen polymerase n=1 Tax=Halotalea alkalilenta TaxID=376489 RepID=UPI0009DE4146|nr:O-antigen polymerase [Halotalea alkalilenta]